MNNRFRTRLPIVVLVVMAALMGWILRVMPDRCIHKAKTAIESWQFDDAQQHLNDYPSWGTAAGHVHFLRARVERLRAGYARAMTSLRTAQAGGFDPQAIEREHTLIRIQDGDLSPQLIGQFESFLKQAPDDRPAIYEVFAIAQFHAGTPQAAFGLLDRWSQEFPRDGRPLYWKGWMRQQLKDDTAALSMYIESTNRNPKLIESHIAQAAIWSGRSSHDHAIQACRNACKFDPDRLDTRIAMGNLYWKLNRKSEAVEILDPITRRHPSVYPAGKLVAQYYSLQDEHAKVISTLQPMMPFFPDDASLNYMLASAYSEIGNQIESKTAMQKFFVANENLDRLRANRFDAPLDEQYAEVLRRASAYRKYDWEQSLKWLNLATQSQPDNPEPHVLLARHYRESGSHVEAVRQHNTAESLAQQH